MYQKETSRLDQIQHILVNIVVLSLLQLQYCRFTGTITTGKSDMHQNIRKMLRHGL